MCSLENSTEYNKEINTEYDIFGDTRNNKKHNELKKYSKHSYNLKEKLRLYYIKAKMELIKEKNAEAEAAKNGVQFEIPDKNKKRALKQMNERDEKYGNNCEIIEPKTKKVKRPKKDRVRF